ncbi:MAG: GerMN domain-containing protein [Clostridia bacterium]|nr:GerMN domain-containing protein [Clostridia bacterium]
MRFIQLMTAALLLMLCGCAGERAVFSEHGEGAAMRNAVCVDIRIIEEGGTLARKTCYLPAEIEMAQAVAERFLEENSEVLSKETEIRAAVAEGTAMLDVSGLPLLEDIVMERAFLGALVLSMTELSDISQVSFLFDGEPLAALPQGAPCYGTFSAEDFPEDNTP